MKEINRLEKGTHIVAVSGGVDSVVLLHILSQQLEGLKLVVAHFDHGMRPDSHDDERFVANLARNYGTNYETERHELGANASEAVARAARYDFLFRMRDKHSAISLVTAHHADDVIETMVINIIRGTGWRGLCSLKSTSDVRRPFLKFSKKDIIIYAKEHNLEWREDSTNNDEHFLRNAVRRHVSPLIERSAWLDLYEKQKILAADIDKELESLEPSRRYDYIMWPTSVALEKMKKITRLTRVQAEFALLAVKTAQAGSVIEVGDKKKLTLTRDNFLLQD